MHSSRKLERWIYEALSLSFFNYEVFIKGECNYQTLSFFADDNAVYWRDNATFSIFTEH